MWFMLEGYESSVSELNRRGVMATATQVYQPRRISGVAFPAEDKARVFRYLGIDPDLYSVETYTDNSNIRLLEKFRQPMEQKVYMQSMESSLRYRSVLQKMSDQLGLSINCYVPHGTYRFPEGNGRTGLCIYVYSTPRETKSSPRLSRAFGREIYYGAGYCLGPSGQGKIITDDEGHQLAEVLPWNIYILFDITHEDGLQEVFQSILERAIPQAMPSDWNEKLKKIKEAEIARRNDEEKHQRELFQRDKEAFRSLYVRACCNRINQAQKSKKTQLTNSERQIEELTGRLVEVSREAEVIRAELAGLESGTTDFAEKFAKEFDQLYENESISRVSIDSEKIEVYTKDIIVQYRNAKYNFGPFLIKIYLSGRYELFALNTPRSSDALVHPHVAQGGQGCLGNISAEVSKLLARQEYVVLINLLIRFLQSYDSSNPYRRIEEWREER